MVGVRHLPQGPVVVRDDLRRREGGGVLRRVAVRHEGDVEALAGRAAAGRVHAEFGLHPGDDQVPHAPRRQLLPQRRPIEGVAGALADDQLTLGRGEGGEELPFRHPGSQPVVLVLDEDDGRPCGARFRHHPRQSRHDLLALVRRPDVADLHIDHQQRRIGRHLPLLPLLTRTSVLG